VALALTVLVPNVGAQDICLPEALGVPNLNGLSMADAPIWWGTGGTMMKRLDDPRWRGAVSQDINGEVSFRALHRTGTPSGKPDTLFLSWTVKIDQNLVVANVNVNPPTGDQLVVGIKVQGVTPSIIIHLGINSSTTKDAEPVGSVVYQWDGMSLKEVHPKWINDAARAWTWSDMANKARWTFQLAVPIGSGGIDFVNLNTTTKKFEMFYAFLVKMPSSFPEYRWPQALPPIRSTTSGFVSYPDPRPAALPWGKLSWGTSTNCAGDVALDANQIGVGDPPVNQINFTILNNQITAKPHNISTNNPIAAGRIQADFFLSNYGSGINNPTFWEKISPATSPTNIAAIPPGGFGLIQFPWPLAAVAEPCKYIEDDPIKCPTLGISDQCILVQLSEVSPSMPTPPPHPAPLVFRNQSTYNNMLFKHSSTLRHRAQISVVGLTPLADGRPRRDVYLYVETVNMPATISAGGAPTSAVVASHDTLIVAHRDTVVTLEQGAVRLKEGDSLVVPIKDTLLAPGAPAGERFAVVREASQAGRLTVGEVDSYVPTYRIHAYHATGDSLGKVPILEPQTSFGYWVEHDGELIGWRHRIEGEHLVRLAPNYYKIEVPNNDRAIITTIIEALERPRFALSLHAGVSLPLDNFNTTHNPGFGITADAEYWWSRSFAVAALLGYHRFPGAAANPDLDLFHGSVALEARLISGSPTVLLDAGAGFYHFDPGSTDPGVHAGLGVEFPVSPTVSLGVTGRIHTVFTSGSNTTFSSLQAGGRFWF
jgi:hypothetical protein